MTIIQHLDERILFFFQSIRCEPLTLFFSLFIKLEFWDIIAVLLIVYFYLKDKKLKIPVISYVLAWNGAFFFFNILKDYFHRPRPFLTVKGLTAVITPHGFSMPSGHATMAMAMVIVLGYHFPKARIMILMMGLLMGLSRLYLGVHYPSDVMVGFLLGALVGILSLILEKLILKVNV